MPVPAPPSASWVMDTVPPTVNNMSAVTPDPRNTPVSSVELRCRKTIDLSTFNYQDLTLTRNGTAVPLASAVTVSLASGTTYSIGGLSSFTAAEGSYVLTVNGAGIKDPAGNSGTGTASDSWTVDLTGPTVLDVFDVTPNPRNQAGVASQRGVLRGRSTCRRSPTKT